LLKSGNHPAAAGRPVVAAIGGSDPSAGAGIQADLKTIHGLGAYAVTVVTSVTAQTSAAVRAAEDVTPGIVREQLEAIFLDFPIAAVKAGMLGTGEIVTVVADFLVHLSATGDRGRPILVVDPVITSTGGVRRLLDDSGVDALKRRLLPLSSVCTPNWDEARALSGRGIGSLEDALLAAQAIRALGVEAVLITGGQGPGEESVDLLVTRSGSRRFSAPRFPIDPHGTGCALASALATGLAAGQPLEVAVERAKRFVTEAIRSALPFTRGKPILDHGGAGARVRAEGQGKEGRE